jgi:hypothetical protein
MSSITIECGLPSSSPWTIVIRANLAGSNFSSLVLSVAPLKSANGRTILVQVLAGIRGSDPIRSIAGLPTPFRSPS